MRFTDSVVALLVAFLPFSGACRPPQGQAASPSAGSAPPPSAPPAAAQAPSAAPVAPAAAPVAAAPVAAQPVAAANGATVDIPANTRLVMRLDDNVDSAKGAGVRFSASLEAALPDANGNVLVPAGTKVLGIIAESKSAGRLLGKSEMEIAFTDLQINGLLFPIQSQGVKAIGEGSGRDTARKVGAAALIGGAFGGGSGAAKGAAIGGAAALLTRGQQIRIPRGTLLELSLVAPARVPAPAAAPTSAPAPVAAATIETTTTTTTTTAPAAASAATPPSASAEAEQKACVKKLMANGFTADEALSSCKKNK